MRREAGEGLSEVVFRTGLVGVGRFRCLPSHPRFGNTGPVGGHLMVFPRRAVTITHAGCRPVVADATRVIFYNDGQEYRRGMLSPDGDDCVFFGLPAAAVAAALADHSAPPEPERPFGSLTHGPCDAKSHLLVRAIREHVRRPDGDHLLIEEAAMTLLDHVLARALHVTTPAAARPVGRTHADLADATRSLLAVRFGEPLSLAAVAALVGVSPFHLCRIFRRHAGRSLHAWRTDLRVRAAAHHILDGAADSTRVALDVGFSSHSHLSTAFRAAFGMPPSALRQRTAATVKRLLGESQRKWPT